MKDDAANGKSSTKERLNKDIDEWNYLDDSSDDGWVEDNDDFTSELEKSDKEKLKRFQGFNAENDS